MKNDCVMPLGNLINKLLRGEADEWCETDFRFYLESLTHGDKKKLEQVLKTVDEAIVNWKSLSFISRYEDKIKEWKEGKCSMGEVDELYFEKKMKALSFFHSQMASFPASRSLEAVDALSKYRGATISKMRAEAFMVVRIIS